MPFSTSIRGARAMLSRVTVVGSRESDRGEGGTDLTHLPERGARPRETGLRSRRGWNVGDLTPSLQPAGVERGRPDPVPICVAGGLERGRPDPVPTVPT